VAGIAVIVAIYVTQRRARVRFEGRRAALVDAIQKQSATLSDSDKAMLGRAETALRRLAGTYEGDLIDSGLRTSGLAPILSPPTAYVHGLMNDFTGDRSIAIASEGSAKDAFLSCLYDPPAARTEDVLIAKVREVGNANLVEQRTPRVSLLRHAEAGMPFLLPPWMARVQATRSTLDLAQMEQAFAQAPIEEAKTAARSRHLLAVLDEGFGAGLDGDRAHDVRVLLVDLTTTTVLLRLRRHVDPIIVSPPSRPRFSVEVDGCVLALDVRESIDD
jgi:hypothetical protein